MQGERGWEAGTCGLAAAACLMHNSVCVDGLSLPVLWRSAVSDDRRNCMRPILLGGSRLQHVTVPGTAAGCWGRRTLEAPPGAAALELQLCHYRCCRCAPSAGGPGALPYPLSILHICGWSRAPFAAAAVPDEGGAHGRQVAQCCQGHSAHRPGDPCLPEGLPRRQIAMWPHTTAFISLASWTC